METESAADEYSLTWKGHSQHIRQSISRLLQSSNFCDVTLYVEGQKIGAHKVLLTACSEYFNKLFSDLKDERPIIVLKGIRIDILQQILRFVYNGQVSIEMDKLNAFLEAAEFLKIHGLINNESVRTRTDSIMGKADNHINTDDERTCMSGCETPNLTMQNVEENSLTSDLDTPVQKHNFQTRSENILAERLLQYRGYGFFKEKGPLQKILKSNVVENLNQEPQLSAKDTQETVYQEPLVENNKYTSISPNRTGDWTSEYICDDNQSQSTQSSIPEVESQLPETLDHREMQSDSSLSKRKRIKLERRSCNLENVPEINQFDEQDFANGLGAEIDFSDDNEEGANWEKEMLERSKISENAYQCEICNKIYMKKDLLSKHLTIHINSTACIICGVTFSKVTHLQRHLSKVHGTKIAYKL